MLVEREKAALLQYLQSVHFESVGDALEGTYWSVIRSAFPNAELFWRYCVVPSTYRIAPQRGVEPIRHRPSVSQGIKDIGALHYSVFANLVDAIAHAIGQTKSTCVLEDTYFHLATICDLVDEWLLRIYILLLECTGKRSPLLHELTREQFIERAGTLHDEKYQTLYDHYYKVGKRGPPLEVVSGGNVVDEFATIYGFAEEWEAYKRAANDIRPYRNATTHNYRLMRLSDGRIPKLRKITKYRKWTATEEAALNSKQLEEDFVDMEEQLGSTLRMLLHALNALWPKPTTAMRGLLFDEENAELLAQYALRLR